MKLFFEALSVSILGFSCVGVRYVPWQRYFGARWGLAIRNSWYKALLLVMGGFMVKELLKFPDPSKRMPDSFRVGLPFWVNIPAHCAVWLSYILTCYHCLQFSYIRNNSEEAVDIEVVDFTFDVLMLPVTFGVMSLHCIRILPDRGGRDLWGATATLDAAEMWESWALWSFLTLLSRYVQVSDEGANPFYSRFERFCRAGVQQYVVFNFGTNILEIVWREIDRWDPAMCGKIFGHDRSCEEDFTKMQEYIIGALWYSCSIAIYSILQFEQSFCHCLRDIQPTWKFWGAKVIVSVAGMQRLGLYALTKLGLFNEVFSWYLHAYFLCFETLLLSLLHFKAYPASGHFVHGTPKAGHPAASPVIIGKGNGEHSGHIAAQVGSSLAAQAWNNSEDDEQSCMIYSQEASSGTTPGGPRQRSVDASRPHVIGRPADAEYPDQNTQRRGEGDVEMAESCMTP